MDNLFSAEIYKYIPRLGFKFIHIYADSIKNINSFDYIEKFNEVTREYTESVLKNVFKCENMIMSVVKSK